ncbi:hypothetical protein ACFSPU_00800 [Haoranjiania flava]|uniref:Nucleotide modification associated domain-containing protein n=1 Tax=Haoranjiania flava TaxID=1856322 RepID=A0AAE3IMS6_9BACT|nr:hypothetical protein [Haoranjiania flava]MCU7693968.1 hypothetical protein [Haoranjiania flava]
MKVILSRKGFDSKMGGKPSPIINIDGKWKYLPLPIPYPVSDTIYDDIVLYNKYKISDVIEELVSEKIRKKNNINASDKCHLDPILELTKIGNKTLQPALGQSDQAESALKKCGVDKGDVFLFFGWYKFAKKNQEDKYQYFSKGDKDQLRELLGLEGRANNALLDKIISDGIHVIYGYLQVGEKYDLCDEGHSNIPEGLKCHPHYKFHQEYFSKSNKERKKLEPKLKTNTHNSIYAAASFLNNQKGIPGSGLLNYHKDLVLSHFDIPQSETYKKSQWKKDFFSCNNYTFTHIKQEKDYIQSPARGQELICKDNALQQWAINLIENHKQKK